MYALSRSGSWRSSASARYPGHLRPVTGRRHAALDLLLGAYDAYEPFIDDCRAVQRVLLDLTSGPNCEPLPGREADTLRLLKSLVTRWNLHRIPTMRALGYLQVRVQLCRLGTSTGTQQQRMFRPNAIVRVEMIPDEPTLQYGARSWTYDAWSGESLKSFRDRIMRDLNIARFADVPAEVRGHLAALADQASALGWPLEDVRTELTKQVQWLFRRLCPQPDHVWGWTRIVDEEPVMTDLRTVKRTVEALAADMDLDLPALRRGRDRKSVV